MAAALEFQAQLGKIVDLAIEHDPGAAIFVEDRLVSTGQVDELRRRMPRPAPSAT
jgi:hypothetical protein